MVILHENTVEKGHFTLAVVWSENVFGCKMRQKLSKIKNISHGGVWTRAYRLGGCYAYHTTTETQVSKVQIFLNSFFIKIAANSKFVVASTYSTCMCSRAVLIVEFPGVPLKIKLYFWYQFDLFKWNFNFCQIERARTNQNLSFFNFQS